MLQYYLNDTKITLQMVTVVHVTSKSPFSLKIDDFQSLSA